MFDSGTDNIVTAIVGETELLIEKLERWGLVDVMGGWCLVVQITACDDSQA